MGKEAEIDRIAHNLLNGVNSILESRLPFLIGDHHAVEKFDYLAAMHQSESAGLSREKGGEAPLERVEVQIDFPPQILVAHEALPLTEWYHSLLETRAE
jgi:hypothetical protein